MGGSKFQSEYKKTLESDIDIDILSFTHSHGDASNPTFSSSLIKGGRSFIFYSMSYLGLFGC